MTTEEYLEKQRAFNQLLGEGRTFRHIKSGLIGVCRRSADSDLEPGDWYIDYGKQEHPGDSVWMKGCFDVFERVYRVRFGVRGIPFFPNAATFVVKVNAEKAEAIEYAIDILRANVRSANWNLAERLFCEVE